MCTSTRSRSSRPRVCASTPARDAVSSPAPAPRSTRRRIWSGSRRHSSRRRSRRRRSASPWVAADPASPAPMNAGETTLLVDGTGGQILDHRTGVRRDATLDDAIESFRLVDAIDDIGLLWEMVDTELDASTPAGMLTMFRASSTPTTPSTSRIRSATRRCRRGSSRRSRSSTAVARPYGRSIPTHSLSRRPRRWSSRSTTPTPGWRCAATTSRSPSCRCR